MHHGYERTPKNPDYPYSNSPNQSPELSWKMRFESLVAQAFTSITRFLNKQAIELHVQQDLKAFFREKPSNQDKAEFEQNLIQLAPKLTKPRLYISRSHIPQPLKDQLSDCRISVFDAITNEKNHTLAFQRWLTFHRQIQHEFSNAWEKTISIGDEEVELRFEHEYLMIVPDMLELLVNIHAPLGSSATSAYDSTKQTYRKYHAFQEASAWVEQKNLRVYKSLFHDKQNISHLKFLEAIKELLVIADEKSLIKGVDFVIIKLFGPHDKRGVRKKSTK